MKTGVTEQPEITFLLRVPSNHAPGKPAVRGVLAFCTWEQDASILRKTLSDYDNPLVAYARIRKLALLTWTTATLWKTGKSFDQIDRRTLQEQEYNFDLVARVWDREVTRMCREHGLPENGFLLYGISRGAHWSCRLALRLPERFLATHIHVANSYEKPQTTAAAQVLWLVSSGDLDRGRSNAINFYLEGRSRNFPMILKVENGLSHTINPKIQRLREIFFDYALRKRDLAAQTQSTPAQLMLADLAQSGLTGELLSQEVFRGAEANHIPQEQRIALPEESFAKVWGYLKKAPAAQK